MYTAISIIIVVASILLTLVVLLQNSKGGGLAANFAAGNQTFGVRQTADFLEKSTWTLAISIIVLCVLATAFIANRAEGNRTDLIEKIENANMGTQQAPNFTNNPVTENETQQSGAGAVNDSVN